MMFAHPVTDADYSNGSVAMFADCIFCQIVNRQAPAKMQTVQSFAPAKVAAAIEQKKYGSSIGWRFANWDNLLDQWKKKKLLGYGLHTTSMVNTWKTSLGIGFAVAILVAGSSMFDAMDVMMDAQFGRAMRDDVSVSFVEASGPTALAPLRALPGVRVVEGFRAVPVTLRNGHREYVTAITGLPPDGALRRVTDRHGSRQHQGFFHGVVEVRPKVHRLSLDSRQHLFGDLGQTSFGVTHGRRAVAVDGAEISLAVDQRIPHGEALRHAHHGVIDRGVAVGMVFTDDIPDDAGALAVGPVPVVAPFAHGEEYPPVHRFKAVPHVRQGPADNDAQGVFQVGLLNLVFNVDRYGAGFRHSE